MKKHIIVAGLAGFLSACGAEDQAAESADVAAAPASGALEVLAPWVRPAHEGARATAGYFELANGSDAERRIVAVEADFANVVELHESSEEDGVMRMRPIDAVIAPVGGGAKLEPGGKHVMFIDLAQPLAEGDSVSFTLIFANGERRTINAEVKRGQ